MSYLVTEKACELPVFRDKVMYISSADSSYKIEQSYVISASFNGILRMSPNSYNTIYENNPVELSNVQDQALSSSYSDAIVFDDSALVSTDKVNDKDLENQANLKTNADIRSRMIIVSESDGYMVSFRMSDYDIEFDNLGVIGITKTGKLTIYSDDDYDNYCALRIGNTLMPSVPNNLDSNRTRLNTLLALQGYEKTLTEQYDEVKIDITGQGDKSYLLKGVVNKDGLRQFEYIRSQQFIRDIIQEALLSVQSVPTGSIHWLPVTYEQYSQLVNKPNNTIEFQLPNKFFKQVNGTDGTTPCDPIVRDYLLCDGRKYKTEEFPELAKILWYENIAVWDSNGKIVMTKEEDGAEPSQYHLNGKPITTKQPTEYPDYFRVPDLRTKFISYVCAPSVTNPLDEEPSMLAQYKNADINFTGIYTPDNAPLYPKGQGAGEHFHFSAYGTYSEYNMTPRQDELYKFQSWKILELEKNISSSSFSPRIWYLSNTAGNISDIDSSGSDDASSYGYAFGFGSSPNRRRKQSSHCTMSAVALASAPAGKHTEFQNEPSVGLTSKSIMIYNIPSTNSETYRIVEDYDNFENYVTLEPNIDKEVTATRYGHENAPKFYAMLPLIKI